LIQAAKKIIKKGGSKIKWLSGTFLWPTVYITDYYFHANLGSRTAALGKCLTVTILLDAG